MKIIYLSKILLAVVMQFLLASLAFSEAYAIKLEKSHMISMRDGVKLSTDLYFPEGAKEKLPVILVRTVYSKNGYVNGYPLLEELVKRGYVIAVQDIRGRFESEGDYMVATGRREDGYDTIDWLTTQPWSNGKLGTEGCSYLGETQVVLSAVKHPNHVVAMPMSAASGWYKPGRAWQGFSGGVFELGQTAGWFSTEGTKVFYGPPAHVDRQAWFRSSASKNYDMKPKTDFEHYLTLLPTLPIDSLLDRAGIPPTDYGKWVASHPDSAYFRNLDFARASDTFNVPALFMDSWYDYGPEETTEMFNAFRENAQSKVAKNNQFMIIGPSTHCGYTEATENTIVGERELGDARLPWLDIQLRWYDYWLKGKKNGITDMPKVQYYLMGKNEWRQSEVWPPKDTTYQKWYLQGQGRANSRHGDGVLSLKAPEKSNVDSFIYDPAHPVPSLGGHSCCTGSDSEAGGYDQSEIELRNDVLVYTSEALSEGIEVTGSIDVVLWVSSSATDTDFTAKLVDVYPDGRAFNIQEGALRMRYRKSLSKAELMTPGELYEIRLDLRVSSNYFAKGNKIRLEITSSNFPRWDRNLNTGGNNYDEKKWMIASNKVHHGKDKLSYLILPVIKK